MIQVRGRDQTSLEYEAVSELSKSSKPTLMVNDSIRCPLLPIPSRPCTWTACEIFLFWRLNLFAYLASQLDRFVPCWTSITMLWVMAFYASCIYGSGRKVYADRIQFGLVNFSFDLFVS